MTISLIAIDPETQQIGSIAASNYTACGSMVINYVQSYGIINVQNWSNPKVINAASEVIQSYNPNNHYLASEIKKLDKPEVRQVIAMTTEGMILQYSGSELNQASSTKIGHLCISSGNFLEKEESIEKIIKYYQLFDNDTFEIRLVKALEAGQNAGGDKRGIRSAAIKVFPLYYPDCEQYPLDLRVDYNEEPISELKRLIEIWQSEKREII